MALAELTYYEGTTASPVPIQTLVSELQTSKDHENKLVATENTIARLTRELQEAQELLQALQAESHRSSVEVQEQINNLEDANNKARENEHYQKILAELTVAKEKAHEIDVQLTEHDEVKIKALQAAKFPIIGLSITDDGVLFNNLPFSQICTSEQTKVSIAIAMAANPTLRVMLSREGSLLDEKNLAMLEQMVKDHDYQLWIEMVSSNGRQTGVVIEDGAVVGDSTEELKARMLNPDEDIPF
jgi:hypothetical protein